MLLIKQRRLLNLISIKQHISFLQCTKLKSTSSDEPADDVLKKQRFAVELDRKVGERFRADEFKARHHPGVMSVKCVELPPHIMGAVDTINEERKYSKSSLLKDARKLAVYISNRRPVYEDEELRQALDEAAMKLVNKGSLDSKILEDGPEKSIEDVPKDDLKKLQIQLQKDVYNWKPIEFGEYMSFVYLIARGPSDYAALVRIFSEIQRRRQDFTPKSFFDFGSGVGTASWALDTVWPEECKEYYNVDSSSAMLELSELLIKNGVSANPGPDRLKVTYFRQFLPASSSLQYDLVVSSRTMFEIGNMNTRARTVDILWRKVASGGFLVLVEAGTKSGYSILLEIRDYLLEINKVEREKHSIDTPIHVFAPCPHDQFCPRYSHRSKTSCHFTVRHNSFLSPVAQREKFSYIVLQKGERKEEGWPRIVQPVLKRHNHIISRTCTPGACIRELVVTKGKHGKQCYHLCKNSAWGDFLPVNIVDNIDSNIDPQDPRSNKNEEEVVGYSDKEEKQDFSTYSMEEKATS